jgi:hypothetical protein
MVLRVRTMSEKTSDQITAIYGETFEKSDRTARHDRDNIAQTGNLDPVTLGQGGRRRWSPWGVSNYFVQGISGRPITDCAETIPMIRSLPLVPARSDFRFLDQFRWFEFPKAQNVGEMLELLIADHQCGFFDTFRLPDGAPLRLTLLCEGEGRSVSLTAITDPLSQARYRGLCTMWFGPEDAPQRTFIRNRVLMSDVREGGPPSVFERIAKALGEPAYKETAIAAAGT